MGDKDLAAIQGSDDGGWIQWDGLRGRWIPGVGRSLGQAWVVDWMWGASRREHKCLLGTWMVDGDYFLWWERGDGGGSELSLGPDVWGRASAHWVSCVPL